MHNSSKQPNKPNKVIIVTGTPGTGKSFLAKKLSLLIGYGYIDVNKLVKVQRLYDSYNPLMDTFIVNTNKLSTYLIAIISSAKKGLIIDSHLSHFLPRNYVNLCIVCKCNLKTLKRRLDSRNYSLSKIRENLDSEIFDVCYNEAKEIHKEIIVADCSTKSSVQSSIKKIKSALNHL